VRSPSDADTDSDDGISTAADTIVRTDLEYEVNDFIAVRGEDCTSEMPFWLAKVREIHKNPDGVIYELTVQWYEVYNGGDCFSGRYGPSHVGRSRKAWVEDIHVDTVLVTFPRLTQSRTIGERVGTRVRRALGIQ